MRAARDKIYSLNSGPESRTAATMKGGFITLPDGVILDGATGNAKDERAERDVNFERCISARHLAVAFLRGEAGREGKRKQI